MLLYVKFCGGCNPTFDRGALAMQIAPLLHVDTVNSHPERADACLLISGCSRNCAKIAEDVPCVRIDRAVETQPVTEALYRLVTENEIGEDE